MDEIAGIYHCDLSKKKKWRVHHINIKLELRCEKKASKMCGCNLLLVYIL